MAKHYPDRFDRGEDFSEAPVIPDELKVCGECEYYNFREENVPSGQFNQGSYRAGVKQCLHAHSGCTDFANGDDILDGMVFVPFDGRICKNFEPCAEALAAAADAAEYDRDPYAYNGVNERDFY